ncbi:MAG: PIG-L family deacetylase [Anaerolineales bacterium]|nr:PIG-L family deacetylase [Anaerolineales bacterium]
MRWIYLSPHLDDAVFSAGGLIYEQTRSGIPVEIWTFMCGDPHLTKLSRFAKRLHRTWGFSSAEETARKRREEDLTAASIVGAKAVHFDFLDCIYRRDKNGKWLYSEIFIPPHAADADYPRQIAETISARLLRDDVLVCQLALGSHVDHVLVRRAAELLGRPLRYDIDVPYWCYKPHELDAKAAGMEESAVRINGSSLPRWIEACVAYKSQLSALGDRFDSPKKVEESIRNYWSERQGIRLFQFN